MRIDRGSRKYSVHCEQRKRSDSTRGHNLRLQELFTGIDETLLGDRENGNENFAELTCRFAAATIVESRARLMAFLWKKIATDGVVFGDPEQNSHINVSNGMNFSYPD